MQEFTVEISPLDLAGASVIKPRGSIDSASTAVLEGHINVLMEGGHNRVVVDLSETVFISSSGIGIFLGTVGALREKGGDLILMNTPPAIQVVFDILNIGDYFHTVSDLSELDPSAT